MRTKLLILCFFLIPVLATAQEFNHPGILNTKSQLDFIKQQLSAGKEPWKSAYNALLGSNYAKLTYKQVPYDSVMCGSYNKPNIGCNQIVDDGIAAYTMALLWYFTGNTQYANKSIQIMNDWAKTYKTNPLEYSNSRLVVSWAAPWYTNAAEIIKHTYNGWSSTDIEKFTGMLDKFLPYTLDETMPGNNWILSAIEAHMAIAIFKDDRVEFNKAVNRWKYRIRTYIYQTSDTNNGKPLLNTYQNWTVSRMESVWRDDRATNTAYIEGLGMETCRDLGHLGLGVNSALYAAESAWNQGVDLFSIEQKRLTDFLELHNSWISGSVAVPSNICEGKVRVKESDVNGITPPNGGGGIAWEIAYNHLHDRLGIQLPYTEKVLLATRPRNASRWVVKWETLLHANVPQIEVTGLDDINLDNSQLQNVSVYPNPFTNELIINNTDNVKYASIFNMGGQYIAIMNGARVPDRINMSDYSSGNYLLELYDNYGYRRIFNVLKR